MRFRPQLSVRAVFHVPKAETTSAKFPKLSTLKFIFDMNLWGRDRDRAVERSPAFELLHEQPRLLVLDALHSKLNTYRVKQRNIRPRRLGTIHQSVNCDLNALQRDLRRLRQYLNQFHSARSNGSHEHFSGGDFFAGAAILFRPIDHEMVISSVAQNSAKSVR